MALGLLKYTSNHRDETVRRTAIVGFDDIDISGYVGLTTVHVAIGDIGRRSAQMLLELIEEKDSKKPPRQEIIPTRLVVRASSGQGIRLLPDSPAKA